MSLLGSCIMLASDADTVVAVLLAEDIAIAGGPIAVTVPWLYDDGTDTHHATLSGDVYPDRDVHAMTLTLDDSGETVPVPRVMRRDAEGMLRETAREMWGMR